MVSLVKKIAENLPSVSILLKSAGIHICTLLIKLFIINSFNTGVFNHLKVNTYYKTTIQIHLCLLIEAVCFDTISRVFSVV